VQGQWDLQGRPGPRQAQEQCFPPARRLVVVVVVSQNVVDMIFSVLRIHRCSLEPKYGVTLKNIVQNKSV
jgi:hypothetical protein